MANSAWDWSTTAASNNSATPYGWPENQNASTVNDCARQMMATLTEAIHSTTAGGTADALTVTLANVPAALTDGMEILVRAAAANTTTTPTLNLNSLGAKTITRSGGSALLAGDIAAAGHELIFRYNSTNTEWELLNPANIATTQISGDFVSTIADATNGGLNFSGSTDAVTAKFQPSDLATKSAPTTSDSVVIMDAAASNVGKTATIGSLFSQLLATDGYITLPNGLIIQWGSGSINANSSGPITFPIAFSTAVLQVVVALQSSSQLTSIPAPNYGNTSTSGMTLYNNDTGGARTISWLAFGH